RGLGHGYGNRDIDVVAFARKVFVPAHIGNDMQVAGRSPQPSAVSLAGYAHPRTGFHAGRNTNLDGFCFRDNAFAFAERTRGPAPSRAFTVRTFLRET